MLFTPCIDNSDVLAPVSWFWVDVALFDQELDALQVTFSRRQVERASIVVVGVVHVTLIIVQSVVNPILKVLEFNRDCDVMRR